MKKLLNRFLGIFLGAGFFFFVCAGCFPDGMEEDWYKSMQDMVNGVKVAYEVGYEEMGLSPNAATNKSRARYYTDVTQQMGALASLILFELSGNFGGGIAAGTEIKLADVDSGPSSYGPFILSEISPIVRNNTIFDTDEHVISRHIVGAQAIEGATVAGQYEPIKDTNLGWLLSVPEGGDYVQEYLNFFMIRLFEITMDLEPSTYASVVGRELDMLEELAAQSTGLGFKEEHIELVTTMVKDEFVGQDVMTFTEDPKFFSEPYIDIDPDDEYSGGYVPDVPGFDFLDMDGNGVRQDFMSSTLYRTNYNVIDGIVRRCMELEVSAGVPVFPVVVKIEVRDLAPEHFYKVPATTTTGQERFMMESQTYRSAVLMFKSPLELLLQNPIDLFYFVVVFDPDRDMKMDITIRVVFPCDVEHEHVYGSCEGIRTELYLGRLNLVAGVNPMEDPNQLEIDLEDPELWGGQLNYLIDTKLPGFNNPNPAAERGYHATAGERAITEKYILVPSLTDTGLPSETETSFMYQNLDTSYVEFVFDPVVGVNEKSIDYKYRFQVLMLPAEG